MASLYQKALNILETRAPKLTRSLVGLRTKLAGLDRLSAQITFLRLDRTHHRHIESIASNSDQWVRAFDSYLKLKPRNMPLFQSFMTAEIKTLKHNPHLDAAELPVLVCVVKDDLERLGMVVEHHRNLGIQRFAILDNGSSDGTLEWLMEQPDIDVYQVLEKFQSLKKYGWINQVLARYGFDQWFLYVDSDELFVYPGCETKSLMDLIGEIEQKGQDRLASILLDMYSDQEIYSPLRRSLSIQDNFPYFDSDSYQVGVSQRGLVVKGGPRKRLFSEREEDSPLLIKFPLFKLKPGVVFESAHYLYPYQQDHTVQSALLHYKFLASDLKRHETIARDGNFQGGSREYRRYLNAYQEDQHRTFMYEGSIKYEDSESLRKITLFFKEADQKEAKH